MLILAEISSINTWPTCNGALSAANIRKGERGIRERESYCRELAVAQTAQALIERHLWWLVHPASVYRYCGASQAS